MTTLHLLLPAALLLAAEPPSAAELTLDDGNLVQFATLEQAREILGRQDEFTRAWTRIDRQVRFTTTRDVDEAEVRAFAAEQARAWDRESETKLREALARIGPRLGTLRFELPRPTIFIRTTGREEADAAYTRANAVILPRVTEGWAADRYDRLLVHELFHVWSRHQHELRAKLYALIGFTTIEPVELPPAWRERKLTNPDGPHLDQLIRLQGDSWERFAVPFLHSKRADYDPQRERTLFQLMAFRLLEVAPVGDFGRRYRPVLDARGEPTLLDPLTIPSYGEQIGRNTQYIIHPDEILADNFARLLLEDRDLPTPRIIDGMREILERPRLEAKKRAGGVCATGS